jgi:hypothetical protein
MNERDNNKANAAVLLSADEAVEKKILDVLLKHPHIIQQALDTLERQQMTHQSQQYQNALQQSMLNSQNARQGQIANVYTSNNTAGNVFPNIFGGKK